MSSHHFGVLNRLRASGPWVAAAIIGFAATVGCSSVDPSVGAWRLDVSGDNDEVDAGGSDADNTVGPGEISFKDQIRPLFNNGSRDTPKGCKGCHYSTETNHSGIDFGGLDLATLGSLRKGGGSSRSKIIVPGKPKESVLIQALEGSYGFAGRMPKNGPFWDDRSYEVNYIDIVAQWIREGAKGADDE